MIVDSQLYDFSMVILIANQTRTRKATMRPNKYASLASVVFSSAALTTVEVVMLKVGEE